MRILLVEDEERVSRFVKRGLTAELFSVDVAMDGETAFYYLKSRSYQMAILDLNLPDISGNKILRYIRTHHGSLPVLILTASGSIANKVESFDHGADDYLTKPFSFTELILRVKALLRRMPPENRVTLIQVADLVLDRSTRRVERDGRFIDLTSKEFKLLEYFMVNAGRVLSRTMIVENVWDQNFEGVTHIVDVYVAQLRKKIDETHKKKMFLTVRGAGYVLQKDPE